jgi:hypothetical protein
MPRSSNFSDEQKATLFVRDRAICAYSGEKLWILDSGATPYFPVDWADHIIPVSKGGASSLENGVCASWHCNKEKLANLNLLPCLFREGRPTKHCSKVLPELPSQLAKYIERLEVLHYSDWYFNRAMFRLLLGVHYLYDGVGARVRDDRYYASATLKAISKWRKLVAVDKVPTLEERNLAPRRPSSDQHLMLDIRHAESVDVIRRIMKMLLPIYAQRMGE